MKISVLGLGKLGYPMAEFLSSSNLSINCYDKDEKLLLKLKKGLFNSEFEYGLENLRNNGNHLNFFLDIETTIEGTDICFITVPTPSNEDGSFSNDYILDCLSEISKYLISRSKSKIKSEPFIININSTVSPNTFSEILIPFLERKGLINNKDFSFIYNPYFVALGDIISDLKHPDIILVGCENHVAKKNIKYIYDRIYNNPNISFMSIDEAELIKLLVNTYLTLKISYSNMVKEISKANDNVDISKILSVIGLDSRIGNKFLKPGGPFSGPCLPRDNYSLMNYYKKNNISNYLSEAILKTNKNSIDLIKKDLNEFKNKGFESIIFAGIGYKSHTPSLEETFILELIEYSKKINLKVYYYDEYILSKIEGAKRISKEDLNKHGNLIFLPYVDTKFKYLENFKGFVYDMWYQLNGANILRSSKDYDKNLENKLVNLKEFK